MRFRHLFFVLTLSACTGVISDPGGREVEEVDAWGNPKTDLSTCDGSEAVGSPTVRRLNREEYDRTVRDLLGTSLTPATRFPSDDRLDEQNGFLTMSSALAFSAVHAERALEAAETLAAEAVVGDLSGCRPIARECVREFLVTFLPRAYRAPRARVDEEHIAGLLGLYDAGAEESPERGLELVLTAVLSSPRFLYRGDLAADARGPDVRANRLAYLIWGTMPDEALYAAAERLDLRTALREEVERMLADPRAEALTASFLDQWLGLHEIDALEPDPSLYDLDPELRAAMRHETELVFGEIVSEGRPILDLLDANFTYVDDRLAEHYGLAAPEGTGFTRVDLPAEATRGGLLTQASFLAITAGSVETSPVRRGKWVLNQVLCAPPPPPPPGAAEAGAERVNPDAPKRERLAQHALDPTCASCHQQIDPLGLAFESFDVLGRFRTEDERGDEVDPSGVLIGGERFDDHSELIDLLRRDERYAQCVVEKLATYALGRRLRQSGDRCEIAEIARSLGDADLSFTDLVVELAASRLFGAQGDER